MKPLGLAAIAAGVAILVVDGSSAFAQDATRKCIRAHEHAQLRQNEGKLAAARLELAICVRGACHPSIRAECTRLTEALDRDQPSIVIHADRTTGGDIVDAIARIDGHVVGDRLDGRVVDVDPGEHIVRVEAPGLRAAEQRIVIGLGEKNRSVRFLLGPEQSPAQRRAKPQVAARGGTAATEPRGDRWSPAVYVLGAVGILAAGTAGYFYIAGYRKDRELRGDCAPVCSDDQVAEVRNRFIAGDIALGVAGLSFGAAVLLITLPRRVAGGTQGSFVNVSARW